MAQPAVAYQRPARVLISAEQIQARITDWGARIDADYAGGTVHLIGILKGSFVFLADLARAISLPARIDFIGISSYGAEKRTSGEV
ncbi:MAG TPA: hypoxanthine phosphoribosyltransferase, partial [Solibacterales bacterium]|nr:hypoxanthine phosphoribosyltransferase [Bryobacterales bacterium]